MSNEIKKLVFLFIYLALFGSFLAFTQLPIRDSIINIASAISFLGEAISIVAVAIFLIIIITSSIVTYVIQKLTNYRKFSNFDSDLKIARIKNFLEVYFYNFIFGLILILPIIFLITTFFPIEETGDLDQAIKTAIIILPGFLLSLRLLTNPVRIKPQFPLLILIDMPDKSESDLLKVREFKERMASFYFSFVETAFFSAIILYIYQIINVGQASFYITLMTKLSPQNPLLTFALFLGVLISIFITTSISEFLLERYKPIIQE
jgi:hypothetical protein